MVYYSGTVIWPTMAGALFTNSVSEVGWLSCAIGGGLLFGQICGGLGVRYLPRMKIQMTIAGIIMMTFVAAVSSSTEYSRGRTTAFILLGTMGAGYVENLTLSTMALVWEPDDIGLVAGVLGAIRKSLHADIMPSLWLIVAGTAAGALATSMYSSILATELTKFLPKYVGPAALHAGLPSSSLTALYAGVTQGSFDGVPGINKGILDAIGPEVKQAYAMSFRTVFLCTVPFGVILILAAIFFCPNVEDYLTDEVARKLQGVSEKPKMVTKTEDSESRAT